MGIIDIMVALPINYTIEETPPIFHAFFHIITPYPQNFQEN